ncbi:MAG: epimerase, partial [Acidobacteria bacterium]
MKVVIAGGSGFLGRPLAAALTADGHDVVTLTRVAPAARGANRNAMAAADGSAKASAERSAAWTPDGRTGPWASEIDAAGAVVNLAGESIAGSRWTAAHKRRILDSRVQ